MTERLPEFKDFGPVRFPLPEGHPLFEDEDALEAALLQDALGSVEKWLPVAPAARNDANTEVPNHLPGRIASGWLGGLAGTTGTALTDFVNRTTGMFGQSIPAWGEANDPFHVRESASQSSKWESEGVSPTSDLPADGSHHHSPEYAMSSTKAPKIIGEPSSSIVSADVLQQHPDTCAIQCQRLILNEFGRGVTEDQLVEEAKARGIYQGEGTSPDDVGKLLESHGVPVNHYDDANIFNLSSELAQGHKVIVGVDSADLWESHNGVIHEILDFFGLAKANHAVIVSGIDTTDPDHVKVNITDPGTGDVAKSYPIEQFLDAWKGSDFTMVSTVAPAPDTSAGMLNFPYGQGHIPMVGHAPYALVQGLNAAIDPCLSTEAMDEVESQYLNAVNGMPIDAGSIVQVGPFPGDAHVQALFDAYGSMGSHGFQEVDFEGGMHVIPVEPSPGGEWTAPVTDPLEPGLMPDHGIGLPDHVHHDPSHGDFMDGEHHHDPSLDGPFYSDI